MRRRATSFIFWLICSLSVLGATSAFAANDHRCCADGCKGLTHCVSVSCQTCASTAGPAPVAPPSAAVLPVSLPLSPIGSVARPPLHEVWKPPRA